MSGDQESAHHELMGGELHVYKRENSKYWQCATFLKGYNHRATTKQVSLAQAKDVAKDWYLTLQAKLLKGELRDKKKWEGEVTFRFAAEKFLREYTVLTHGQRSPIYVGAHRRRLENHIYPFMADKYLPEVTPGLLQDYRVYRHEKAMELYGKPPARNTIHQEVVVIRQVLKAAVRHGWLKMMPDLSEPYKKSGKVSHRAWLAPDEYKRLYQATRERAQNPKRTRYAWESEQLHDFVLFMVNTGLRPDEAWKLQFRDVKIAHDDGLDETILEIEVRGKRGVGYCKSMPGAVLPYKRLLKRMRLVPDLDENGKKVMVEVLPKPTDLLFPKRHHELFDIILNELDLKKDRDGQARTAYSLRHTYICLRLMEGADVYQIAKNCRTSVEMIEKFYASHLVNTLDTTAINVRKVKRPARAEDEDPTPPRKSTRRRKP
ncbi:tyrosine-type recombinase/integrase [Bradyrhizobium japonicum]|uniref:tyrosine-type recombinase/integrase n=1 Tax=Bradyrhizobium japonicum TaxID=375 RepID=UPI0004B5C540|nr:phage integrase SAM-like domain-containing protein [Bradyrhizobium japonicum]